MLLIKREKSRVPPKKKKTWSAQERGQIQKRGGKKEPRKRNHFRRREKGAFPVIEEGKDAIS